MMETCGSPEYSWKCSVGKLIPEHALKKENMCLCRQIVEFMCALEEMISLGRWN